MNEHWNFKANVMNLLHSLYRQEHEKANIYKSLCVEKELEVGNIWEKNSTCKADIQNGST